MFDKISLDLIRGEKEDQWGKLRMVVVRISTFQD